MSRLAGRARALARRARGWLRPGVPILIYHRVAEPLRDPFELSVSPAHFDQQLEVMRREFRPMALSRLVEALDGGRLPRRAVAVTFDDGYWDNFDAARPLLERHEVPATIFVATGSIGLGREYWWDELERIILGSPTLPRRLSVTLGDDPFEADLGEGAGPAPGEAPPQRRWRYDDEAPSPRHRLYQALYPRLQRLAPEAQARSMEGLRAWAGGEAPARPGYRPMTEGELALVAASPVVEIGAHTHDHALLPALPAASQREQVESSRSWLRARIGRAPEHFSYPYGKSSPETAAIVRDSGFLSSCATRPASLRAGADRFALPRLSPGDWDGDRFARTLRAWLAT